MAPTQVAIARESAAAADPAPDRADQVPASPTPDVEDPAPETPAAEEAAPETADVTTAEGVECCGEDDCRQPCESPADCPRCRPLCESDGGARTCAAPPPPAGRPECRRDDDCILVDADLPCSACGRCPGPPDVWSRAEWRREVRRARRECNRGRREHARCSPCPRPRPYYRPTEAICVAGRCVAHGGTLVDPREPSLEGI